LPHGKRRRLCVCPSAFTWAGLLWRALANVASALVAVKWGGFGLASATWAVVVIAVALLITLAVIATRKDVAYSLVLVWALVGIAVNQSAYQNIVLAA
jgi:hypothetical protein